MKSYIFSKLSIQITSKFTANSEYQTLYATKGVGCSNSRKRNNQAVEGEPFSLSTLERKKASSGLLKFYVISRAFQSPQKVRSKAADAAVAQTLPSREMMGHGKGM